MITVDYCEMLVILTILQLQGKWVFYSLTKITMIVV